MLEDLTDDRLRRVLSLDGDDKAWRADLERLRQGDQTLTRRSAGEEAIKAVQRLLVFLGYSTATTGAFLIDGDFGRGTNRGVAQFQFEHGLTDAVKREDLCYECTFETARQKIVAVPDTRLDIPTLDAMLKAAADAIETGNVTFGRFEDALFHLNALHRGVLALSCKEVLARYGEAVDRAVARIREEKGVDMQREWVLSIIKQETGGISRPRFEQHKLSSFNAKEPDADLAELRVRSMSIGLGQIMGFNYEVVGAPSARAMLSSPVEDQVLYVARFIAPKAEVVAKRDPTPEDYRAIARYYNGPAYEKHFYHEKLETWFREFLALT